MTRMEREARVGVSGYPDKVSQRGSGIRAMLNMFDVLSRSHDPAGL